MKVLAYWGVRVALFAAVLLVLWLVGWYDVIAIVAAAVLAWLISYIALPRQRVEAGQQFASWIDRSQRSQREANDEEDAELGRADIEPETK
jgi:Flp pilus assembly protein TadB